MTSNLAESPAQPSVDKPRLPARVLGLIGADQILSQSLYFAVMPVLPLLLTMKLGGEQKQFVAWAISALTLMTRGGTLFVASLLHRLSVRGCVRIALALIAVTYAVVAVTSNPWALILALAAAGLGFSVNGTGVRSFIILATSDTASQNRGFALIQIVANCAAALGPILGSLVLDRGLYNQFLLGVSAVFLVAAVSAPMAAPLGLMLNRGSLRPPMGLGILRELISEPKVRLITFAATAGSILMGQFFSSFSLVFSSVTTSPLLRALFYALNGALVVIIQMPVSLVVERKLRAGASVQRILVIGVCILGAAMPFFSAKNGLLGVVLVTCGVIIFSFGETVFTPILNVAFANATEGRPVVEAMNMRQLTSAVGETLGVWMGLSVFTSLTGHRLGLIYWCGLVVVAALCLLTLPARSTDKYAVTAAVRLQDGHGR
mgnify:CR=1 FL=1